MTSKKETFATLLHSFDPRYEQRSVFDDFLTITISAFSQNPHTGKSHDEELYMTTIEKYTKDEVRNTFPKMLSCLVLEMEERVDSGNDVLGDFYEQNLYRKGASQYFTPWPVCMLIASCLGGGSDDQQPRRILDPSCGSGRILLAGAKCFGKEHLYYGIDVDHTCVKMAAINVFLNGMFGSEIMWANSLDPECFYMSYAISFLPFGIFRIGDKENSRLWKMHRNSFNRKQPPPTPTLSFIASETTGNGTQIELF